MLGDFNARVGVYDDNDELWSGVLGKYGTGVCNLAGEDLLQFFDTWRSLCSGGICTENCYK